MVWLKHREETAHTDGIEVHWCSVASVHTYGLAIERGTTRNPHCMLNSLCPCWCCLFVHFLCQDCLRWIAGLFISQQIELPEGWLAGLALALLKPHSGVGFDPPPPFCWSCHMAYFAVLWRSSCWLWLRLLRMRNWFWWRQELRRWGWEGALRDRLQPLPQLNLKTRKKNAGGKMLQGASNLPFHQGRSICICPFQQMFV